MLRSTAFLRGVPSLPTEASGPAPPDAFGPFRVLHQIGAGALGPVFRAYEPEQDRLVAVKLFRLDLPPERVHHLVQELERLIAADLTHPAIAAPLSTGISGASAYLAQDFVAADSLDVVIRDHGPAPAAEALRVATQLAGALDFAAAVDVHHGALHPRDVLVSSDDTRVTGLGVARAIERVGLTPPIRRPYSAPERGADQPWDRRADVFGLAALIHELMWGRRPAGTGAQAAAALTPVAGADFEALRDVFARALAEDPADRFGTALAFAEALRLAVPAAAQSAAGGVAEPARGAQTARATMPLAQTSEPERPHDQSPATDQRLPLDEPGPGAHRFSQLDDEEPVETSAPLSAASLRSGAETDSPEVHDDLYRAAPPSRDAGTFEAGAGESLRPVPTPSPQPVASRGPARHTWDMESGGRQAERQERSGLWPLALTALIFLAVGYALGHVVGSRQPDAIGTFETEMLDDPGPRSTAATSGGEADGREAEAGVVAGDRSATPPAPEPAPAQPRPSAATHGPAAAPSRPPATVERSPAPAPRRETPPTAAPSRAAGASTPAAAAAPGRVLVRSTPAGARVLVDGRDAGVTPVAVRNLSTGGHTVTVLREGYSAAEQRVSITAARPSHSLSFELTPEGRTAAPSRTYTASLRVESRPAGATVLLDGRRIGTTPLSIGEVPIGEHAVWIELDGYRRWTASVRVVANQQNRVTASLESAR